MMILARDFVFVHMPKTGGTFVRTVLRKAPGDWAVEEIMKHIPASSTPDSHRHLPAFGCIRNPFSWYVSWYCYHMERDDEEFADFSKGKTLDFKQTLLRAIEMKEHVRRSDQGPYTLWLQKMFGVGCSGVHLCRCENLAEDLQQFLSSVVDVPAAIGEAIRENAMVNLTARSHFSSYYDTATREMIAEKDSRVFELMGYGWEDPGEDRAHALSRPS